MLGFVISLTVLSVMFSLISGAAYLYRRLFLKGCEGLMYPVWILILAISVIPARVSLPAVSFAEDTVQTVYALNSDRAGSSGLTSEEIRSGAQSSGEASGAAATGRLLVEMRRFIRSISSQLEYVCAVIFLLWLAGAVISFSGAMSGYFQAKRLLSAASSVCMDERLYRILGECKRDLRIRRGVSLRVFDGEALCSPCVCGCLNPVMYLDPGCSRLDETELRCVISHELSHIRRNDMPIKLFALFVTSVHWMNPTSRRVLHTVFEDCELACDSKVIRTYGNKISGIYMNTILDFAERFSETNRLIGAQSINGSLFISRPSGVRFLKRRYANMKNTRNNRLMNAALSVFAAVCVLMNVLALSSCTGVKVESSDTPPELTAPVRQMLLAYYGLGPNDRITDEMLGGITSLTVEANTSYGDRLLADFTVNGEEGFAQALPTVVTDDYWDKVVEPALEKEPAGTADLKTTPVSMKLKAFYALKNPDDPALDADGRKEMLELYPLVTEKGALYIFDPYSSERELQMIYGCCDTLGLLAPWELESTEFDASSLAYFPNLGSVTFTGLTPVNYEFPQTVSVTVN